MGETYAGSAISFPFITIEKEIKSLKIILNVVYFILIKILKSFLVVTIHKNTVLYTFGYIKIKEIAIQKSLNTASHNCYPVIEPLCIKPPDPINDVETSIETESKEIVRGDGFRFSSLRYHV